jgi:hypothetical protein
MHSLFLVGSHGRKFDADAAVMMKANSLRIVRCRAMAIIREALIGAAIIMEEKLTIRCCAHSGEKENCQVGVGIPRGLAS